MKHKASRKQKKLIIYALFLCVFLLAEVLQGIDDLLSTYVRMTIFLLSNTLLFSLIIVWAISIKHRIVQNNMRKNLFFIAGLLLFWLVIRFIKYKLTVTDTFMSHFLWSLYYVPQCLVPPTLFIFALSLNQKEHKYKHLGYLIYLPAIIIISLILTNEWHELAFSFSGRGMLGYSYRHEIVYYLAIIWICVITLASIGVLIVKCSVSSCRKKVWIPLTCLMIGGSFAYLCFATDSIFFKQPETMSVVCISVLESCIWIGIIPSNDNYESYFNLSKLSAFITDEKYTIVYQSENALPLDKTEMQKAILEPVFINPNMRVSSKKIRGGYSFWLEDLTEINNLHNQLQEINENLSEENDLIVAENELKERIAIIDAKNRIYDKIAELIEPKINLVKSLLNDIDINNNSFEHNMHIACVMVAFIKRKSNLTILMENNNQLDSNELVYSIKESLDYVSLCNIDVSFITSGNALIPNQLIICLFDFYETWLESAIPTMTSCIIRLRVTNNQIELRLIGDDINNYILESRLREEINTNNGKLMINIQDSTTYTTITFELGGNQ